MPSADDQSVPDAARQEDRRQVEGGAAGELRGFHDNGTVYLIAPALKTRADVVRTLFHESLGHYGLRGLYGSRMGEVMGSVALLYPDKVRAKAEAYGLDMGKDSDRALAAEEVLAELAESSPSLSIVQKAIAAVRSWLRAHGFSKLTLSEAELVRDFIAPARAFVEGKAKPGKPAKYAEYAGVGDPLADGYKRLEGRKVSVQVRVADTGEIATLTLDAAQELRDLDERADSMRKLIDCLAK